jgi:hypothetical protein
MIRKDIKIDGLDGKIQAASILFDESPIKIRETLNLIPKLKLEKDVAMSGPGKMMTRQINFGIQAS